MKSSYKITPPAPTTPHPSTAIGISTIQNALPTGKSMECGLEEIVFLK
jgi:hypothetical protein